MNSSIAKLDEQFAALHRELCELTNRLTLESLYRKTPGADRSCGEEILRSAAIVERAFGGLTANLWDDPFEWTLPETLASPEKLFEYLDEVAATRRDAFEFLKNDSDLSKKIMTPTGNTQLLPFLLDTFQQARHHQQRALELFQLLQSHSPT